MLPTNPSVTLSDQPLHHLFTIHQPPRRLCRGTTSHILQGYQQTTPEEAEAIFNQMFGGGAFGGFADILGQRARQRGPDLQAQLRITLREAANGVKKTIHIPTRNISGGRDSRKIEVDIPAGLLLGWDTLMSAMRPHWAADLVSDDSVLHYTVKQRR